ncbi:hypothetical protein [Streptomyces clavuligerus]|uniref:hypothetical protein n=1 Tax=Streptomyces clavuligerus TaxID=1901 RepID=UPI001F0775BE|nr:hypothetical protein [Streptomyces clavuligerus]
MVRIAIGVDDVAWAEVIRELDLSDGFFGTAHLLLPAVGLLTLLSTKRLYTASTTARSGSTASSRRSGCW